MLKKSIYIVLLTALPYLASSNESGPINIDIKQPGRFDVLYHRAESDATSAVLFGVIGAGIDEGIRSDKDEEKKTRLLQHMAEPSCQDIFVSSLLNKLNKEGYQPIVLGNGEAKNESKDVPTLEVKINVCGFKMVDTYTKQVAAFVSFHAYLKKENRNLPFDEKFIFAGKKSYVFEELLNLEQEIEKELISVLKRAGKRLANKIIYRKEG